MNAKDFISIVFNPVWKWGVEIFLGVISLLTFFFPSWSSKLNFPSFIQHLDWRWWLIFGLVFLIISIAWEATKKISKIRTAAEKVSGPVIIKAKTSNQRGGQNIATQYYYEGDKKGDGEIILGVHDKVSELMSRAIKDIVDFGTMWERNDGRSRKDRKTIAFQSKDEFHECYEKNKNYFSVDVRNAFEKLDKLMERSLRNLSICFNNMENMERDLNIPPHRTIMPQEITEIHEIFEDKAKIIQNRILDELYEFRKSLAKQ